MKKFFFFLKKLKKNYEIGYNSKIYKESSIENLTNNPAKIKIGNNCSVRGKLLVFAHGGEILIGNNVFIGENTQIWSASKIIIEDNVMISHSVNIIDTNSHPKNANLRSQHHLEIITKGHPIQGQIVSQIESFPIIIKKNSWISFNVTILKNVTIGENSIVGANTVINKNIKDNTIVFSEIKNIEKEIDNK